VRVDEPRVLKDGANLVLHLAPAPVVARIAMRIAELRPDVRRRELDITLWLHERGLPVTPPAEELPAIVYEHAGFAITFWKLLREGDPDPVEAGRGLRAIDEALRGYDGDIAGFWPVYESTATTGTRGCSLSFPSRTPGGWSCWCCCARRWRSRGAGSSTARTSACWSGSPGSRRIADGRRPPRKFSGPPTSSLRGNTGAAYRPLHRLSPRI
jgi:hypothetical protein